MQATLKNMLDVHPSVSASVHWAAAQYAKLHQDFEGFYQASVRYLAYINSEELEGEQRTALAVDIALSALLGEGIFGFGELLLHPIVTALDTPQLRWLRQILDCFEKGDLHRYEALCVEHAAYLNAQPALVAHERRLREKITILCLLELVFATPPDARTIPLAEVAARAKLSIEGVEALLMRCLSLHLIEGSIDAVEGVVHVTWITPRVLTMPQIRQLRDRLGEWVNKVQGATQILEGQVAGLAEV